MGTPASEPSPNHVDEFEPKGSILVVGSTGKLGRLIVGELLERGYEVLALVSSEERAEEVRGYFTRLHTVQVRRLYLIFDLRVDLRNIEGDVNCKPRLFSKFMKGPSTLTSRLLTPSFGQLPSS